MEEKEKCDKNFGTERVWFFFNLTIGSLWLTHEELRHKGPRLQYKIIWDLSLNVTSKDT